MIDVTNPMLEDDDDYEPVAPPRTSFAASRKPVKSRKGSPRARATAKDVRLLAHVGKFILMHAESARQLLVTEPNPIDGSGGGTLPSVVTVTKRLEKLKSLGYMRSRDIPGTNRIYGITSAGVSMAQRHGYLLNEGEAARKTLDSYSGLDSLNHDLAVSHVAAQFASPIGYFKESLNLRTIRSESLVSEYELRRHQKITENESLKGTDRKWGEWRAQKLAEVEHMIAEGRMEWRDVLDFYPELWVFGQPARLDQGFVCSLKFPDLVVSRESKRTSRASGSLAVEVELTKKSNSEYERILRTYALELQQPMLIQRVLYVTNNVQVRNLVTKIDRAHGFGLVNSGRLEFIDLTASDGVTLMTFARTM
ncbi:hypothetical protein [uncultured Microbacterium sp.]|uniref:hypothetical protein n=1 Tax=uncultured Microbacterium sp. TaxID=191216 RepID=UPI0025FD52C0|nr:hypothetical protein [uncultured Microbacterium sp.]